jgi:hypothetical protein
MKKQQQTQEQQVQEQKAKNAAFFQRKPGDALTFLAPGSGEVTLYGNLDVSFDYTTKGLKSDYGDMGMPVGKIGWQPAIATNLSYVGVRGTHPLKDDFNFIWQLEAGIDISATPGTNSQPRTSATPSMALYFRGTASSVSPATIGARS